MTPVVRFHGLVKVIQLVADLLIIPVNVQYSTRFWRFVGSIMAADE